MKDSDTCGWCGHTNEVHLWTGCTAYECRCEYSGDELNEMDWRDHARLVQARAIARSKYANNNKRRKGKR